MANDGNSPTCFVIMPFGAEFDDVLEDAIAPAAALAGFTPVRADATVGPGSIMKSVIQGIFSADVVVADLSTSNPNVLYELGIAHTISDKTVMICEKTGARLPFDLADYRTLFYERSKDGLRVLKRELTERLKNVPKWSVDPTSPVRQFGPRKFTVPFAARAQQSALEEILRLDGTIALRASIERRDDKAFIRGSDATLLAALGAHLKDLDRAYEQSIDLANPSEHVIVTGSPRYNGVAQQIQEYFDLPYEYVWARADEEPSKRALRIVTVHGDELSSSRDNFVDDRVSAIDYGILLVGNLSRGKRILWFSGIHGSGTLGVYKCFSDNAERILGEYTALGRQDNVAIGWLVRIHYDPSSSESSLDGVQAEVLGEHSVCRLKKGAKTRRAIFVDLGGVVMYFDRTRTYRAIAHFLQLSYPQVQDRIENTDIREQYERGKFSDEEFCAKICALFGPAGDQLKPLLPELWGDIFWPNREMFEALRWLKRQDVVLVLISNTNALHFQNVARDYPDIIGLFDKKILSYELGMEKPDRGVYEGAISWVGRERGISPSDVLYVDDTREHVQAARACGLRGFVYRSYPHFVFWLRKQGLYVP